MPVYAILFGEVLGVLSKDVETARSDSIFYSFMFLVVGVVVGLAMFLQGNIKEIQIILRIFLVLAVCTVKADQAKKINHSTFRIASWLGMKPRYMQ